MTTASQTNEVSAVLEATGLRVSPDHYQRTGWERRLVATWGEGIGVWEPGMCRGCGRHIDDEPAPLPLPGLIDDNGDPVDSAGDVPTIRTTVCHDCDPISRRHYEGEEASETPWWDDTCPPAVKTLLDDRRAPIDWNRVDYVRGWNFFEEKRGLVLVGDTGTGKTTALWALAHRLEKQDTKPLFVDAVEFARRASKAAKDMADDTGLMRCKYLLIDDLCKEKLTPTVASAIWRVFDHRLAWNRWTVITTRFTGNEFQERFADHEHLGADIRRRIGDMCRRVVFERPE